MSTFRISVELPAITKRRWANSSRRRNKRTTVVTVVVGKAKLGHGLAAASKAVTHKYVWDISSPWPVAWVLVSADSSHCSSVGSTNYYCYVEVVAKTASYLLRAACCREMDFTTASPLYVAAPPVDQSPAASTVLLPGGGEALAKGDDQDYYLSVPG